MGEKSVGVNGRHSGTEVETIRKARVKSAEKRFVKLEAERVSENALLEEVRARFARLEAQGRSFNAATVPRPQHLSRIL